MNESKNHFNDEKNKLVIKIANKALDIPMDPPSDDMNIDARKTGISGLAAAGIALAAGLPVAGLAGFMLYKSPAAPAVVPSPVPIVAQPAEFDEMEAIPQPDGTLKSTGKIVGRVRVMPNGSVQTRQPDGSWK